MPDSKQMAGNTSLSQSDHCWSLLNIAILTNGETEACCIVMHMFIKCFKILR